MLVCLLVSSSLPCTIGRDMPPAAPSVDDGTTPEMDTQVSLSVGKPVLVWQP